MANENADLVTAAHRISDAINAAGRWQARVWSADSDRVAPRVYLSERLSRGVKELGYVEILEDGDINVNPISNGPKAAVRSACRAALAI